MCLNIILIKDIHMRKHDKFKKEYYLQRITNKNLRQLFDLKFITAEFQLNDLRFDGLAYDEKTKSFVIIEYKNKKDLDVLNQGQTYYNLLQENRDKYINRYNDEFDTDLKENDFEFEKTRVMIISTEFTKEQIEKSENPEYPFELYLATLYKCDDENGCITYEKINSDFIKRLDIKLKDLKISQEELLEDKSSEMIDLYTFLKDQILNEFDDVSLHFQVNQFSFRVNDNLICVVIFLKSSFSIILYGKDLKNDVNIAKTKDNNYKIKYESDDDFDYFLNLFRQAYEQKRER